MDRNSWRGCAESFQRLFLGNTTLFAILRSTYSLNIVALSPNYNLSGAIDCAIGWPYAIGCSIISTVAVDSVTVGNISGPWSFFPNITGFGIVGIEIGGWSAGQNHGVWEASTEDCCPSNDCGADCHSMDDPRPVLALLRVLATSSSYPTLASTWAALIYPTMRLSNTVSAICDSWTAAIYFFLALKICLQLGPGLHYLLHHIQTRIESNSIFVSIQMLRAVSPPASQLSYSTAFVSWRIRPAREAKRSMACSVDHTEKVKRHDCTEGSACIHMNTNSIEAWTRYNKSQT